MLGATGAGLLRDQVIPGSKIESLLGELHTVGIGSLSDSLQTISRRSGHGGKTSIRFGANSRTTIQSVSSPRSPARTMRLTLRASLIRPGVPPASMRTRTRTMMVVQQHQEPETPTWMMEVIISRTSRSRITRTRKLSLR